MRLILVLLCCVCAVPALAENRREALQKIETNLQRQQQADKELAQKSAVLQQKLDVMRNRLVALTQNMQTHEQAVMQLRQAARETDQQIAVTRQQLEGQRSALAQIIMAKQRLDRVPAQALLLRPSAPIDMARSFELLQKAIPEVSGQAAEIKATFGRLEALRQTQVLQENNLISEQAALKARQDKLEAALKERQTLLTQTKTEQQSSNRKSRELAGQAKDLHDLLERVARNAALKAQTDQAEKQHTVSEPDTGPEPVAQALKSLADWFGRVKAKLRLPVTGNVATGYGQGLAGGGQSQGLTIKAAPGAIVTAPADGIVRFAGPFRQYKLLVILQHSNGEHSLLGGMQELYTRTGAKVAAGEPLGKLPSTDKLAGDSTATASLYYEKRRNGKAVDPRS